jgi:CBS domain containing-hemolysin-like protein
MKAHINDPLAAILTLNTVSHTLGASLIGAQVYELYGNQAVTTASVILTLAVLIFSEIIPKTLGASYWKVIAPPSAYLLQGMIVVTYPLVKFTKLISRLLKPAHSLSVTREEVIASAEIGAHEGTLHSKESVVIKNILMLSNIYVEDIMTPQNEIYSLDSRLTVEDVANRSTPIRFSRIPVYKDQPDKFIGITHRFRILEALSKDQHGLPLSDIVANVTRVYEKMSVSAFLDYMIRKKEHLALVEDTDGKVVGIVTLEDAIETLLGVEIMDEFDSIENVRKAALSQVQARKSMTRL